MVRRGIPIEKVREVMEEPEQRLPEESRAGHWVYQSRLRFEDGRLYLLRVVVAEEHSPPVVVTVYRTSKIEKYWGAE
jgi:hypothetical protein